MVENFLESKVETNLEIKLFQVENTNKLLDWKA